MYSFLSLHVIFLYCS